jgi:dsRNA-specific ribonuclease
MIFCRQRTQDRLDGIEKVVLNLLSKGEIPHKLVKEIVNSETMPQLDRALTHESYDKENNYDVFEFIGDSIVNLFVAKFVLQRLTEKSQDGSFIGAGAATMIKHSIQSNKILGEMAETYGLTQLLLFVPKEIPPPNHSDQPFYNWYDRPGSSRPPGKYLSAADQEAKIKGDVFEAIIGCLYTLVSEVRMENTALLVCGKVITKLLQERQLVIDPLNCKDFVTTFKEEYPDFYRWGGRLDEYLSTKKLSETEVKVTAYGVVSPGGKKVFLAEATGTSPSDVKAEAAQKAIQVLESMGIFGKTKIKKMWKHQHAFPGDLSERAEMEEKELGFTSQPQLSKLRFDHDQQQTKGSNSSVEHDKFIDYGAFEQSYEDGGRRKNSTHRPIGQMKGDDFCAAPSFDNFHWRREHRDYRDCPPKIPELDLAFEPGKHKKEKTQKVESSLRWSTRDGGAGGTFPLACNRRAPRNRDGDFYQSMGRSNEPDVAFQRRNNPRHFERGNFSSRRGPREEKSAPILLPLHKNYKSLVAHKPAKRKDVPISTKTAQTTSTEASDPSRDK